MTVTLMWEARATEGRGGELLAWALDQELSGTPLRRETFRAPQDRVLVLTWWPGTYATEVPELPDPPGDMVTRPVHRWRFEPVDAPDPVAAVDPLDPVDPVLPVGPRDGES